jgi:hypothetical protein
MLPTVNLTGAETFALSALTVALVAWRIWRQLRSETVGDQQAGVQHDGYKSVIATLTQSNAFLQTELTACREQCARLQQRVSELLMRVSALEGRAND